jgi:multicomponent Na+:H+ antiporter subunit E
VGHFISLGAVLFGVWLLLSGHFDPLLIGLGVVSCVVVALITLRMELIDHEGHPVHLTWRGLFFYWPWLGWEIVKANWDVAKRVLAPSMPISPTMVRVDASQKTDLGIVIYANSITLTPGTVSVDVGEGKILVHALTREGAEAVREGTMNRRVTRMVGEDR